jgi:lipopolysaccharide transport system ATP-binding protein
MSAIITVEQLGKKYLIGHQRGISGVTSFRENMTRVARSAWQRMRHPLSPNRETTDVEEMWALKDVSFDVQPGERLGIIGRNGAGKSTLLKILSRITHPTTGRVHLKGRVSSLLEVGTGFHPELTGRENVFLNGAILGMTKNEIRKKFDEIIAFAEVEKFLDTPVKRYSSGMYVRLAFAVAAHLEPEILIVDEVLAVGDAQFQKKCLGRMNDVAKEGRTVLFVSHNMAAVSNLTAKALFLENGSLAFEGHTSEAISRYAASAADNRPVYQSEKDDSEDPRIESIALKTSLGSNIQAPGESFQVEIMIRTRQPIDGACVSVQIYDANQVNFVHLWAHDTSVPICRQSGIHRLTYHVPRLRLYAGKYRLRVFFTEPPGGRSFEILEGVCPFDVVMPDKQRLFMWYPGECAYVEDYSWEACRVAEL